MPSVNVLTNRYDNARRGSNLNETILNTSNVNVYQFGKLFTRDVDGDVYAQPLVVSGVNIAGQGLRNVAYVATANNSVYAYDADDPSASTPYWHVAPAVLGTPVPRSEVGPQGYSDFQKTIGITSTPVIDLTSKTIYVEVKSKKNGSYFHHLHALDIETGQERGEFNSPVQIQASVNGNATDNQNGVVIFNPRNQLNRPGLLLCNGVIYIAFASHGDLNPYHGWVLAYDAHSSSRSARSAPHQML